MSTQFLCGSHFPLSLESALPVSACASVCPHGFRCSKHGSRAPQGRRLVHHPRCLAFRCVWTCFVALSSASDGVRLAASFPTISKLLPVLKIPTIVFFIGKHFGTGVILATAFIHSSMTRFARCRAQKSSAGTLAWGNGRAQSCQSTLSSQHIPV
jgi:hypothetical protein